MGAEAAIPACRLVSSRAGVAHHKLHRHVHLGTGRGLLAALEVVFAQSGPYAGSHAEELFQRTGISQDERHALRQLLLQVGFSSISHQLLFEIRGSIPKLQINDLRRHCVWQLRC